MIIPVIYPSALQFWQDSHLLNYSEGFSLDRRIPALLPDDYDFHPNTELFSALSKQFGFTNPVHLLAPNAKSRSSSSFIKCSVKPLNLPPASFVKIDSFTVRQEACHIYVASPELCFLEAARHLSFFELVKLGFDLCAIYLPDITADYGHIDRKPITTRQNISDHLDSISNIKGIRPARTAIKYVLDRSNSPMETFLSMFITLQMSYGGYGLPQPSLNQKILLSNQGIQLLHRSYCACDIVWEKQKLIIEYDSNLTHLNREQHAVDKARQSALTLSGYQVISLTADNLRKLSDMDKFFIGLRQKLGLRNHVRLNKYIDRRYKLFQFLTEKNNLFTK